jgi:cation diffusion facilitator CzcD-associated flavoprotein CzcO
MAAKPKGLWELFPPINEPRRQLEVICVGAGASGLLVAYKLQKNFDGFDLTVYEKNADISGTWFENKYPGSVLVVDLKTIPGYLPFQMCLRRSLTLLYLVL